MAPDDWDEAKIRDLLGRINCVLITDFAFVAMCERQWLDPAYPHDMTGRPGDRAGTLFWLERLLPGTPQAVFEDAIADVDRFIADCWLEYKDTNEPGWMARVDAAVLRAAGAHPRIGRVAIRQMMRNILHAYR
ncbi:hypothetical protein [Zavarzinia compransoris]|uniref:Uncharacterized protein n=1 Tax=Zavarzinia compransoris TaxID=1264899 RepID=A0A317E120_9PROT|nr:hypothetical protein [Zavarzinia compransoris]PWR20777.1 hypothetical protein DKG75_12340 [Zavarzinia compransoris]TDP44389.1 hypothetical protein DES42_107156 [Zavarzinia compransoris]